MKFLHPFHTEFFDQFATRHNRKPNYRFRLVDFKDKRHKSDLLLSQTKCNLEILPQGMMIVGNFSGSETMIPVLKNEIESIKLVRGKETIDTFLLSPMHILSKLGVPSRISRHVSIYPSEYKITATQITIKCQEFQLKLITNGSSFNHLVRRFKKTGYSELLNSELKPIMNLLHYSI